MTGARYSAAILLLVFVVPAQPQEDVEHCAYMQEIPRPPTPEFPEFEFDGPWSERQLLPPPSREEVCMGIYSPLPIANLGQQIIYMEEEIEGDVIIAKLNYEGTAAPTIQLPFMVGDFQLLGAVVRRVPELENGWYLVITQRQDYEIQAMQSYTFQVQVSGESMNAVVSLIIVNIDDNAPIIQAVQPCVVPELGEPRLTECEYEIRDHDGEISTRFMKFRVLSDRNDDEIFYIEGRYNPADWYNMHMIVGILQPLNFDTNRLHVFNVLAEDSGLNNDTASLFVRVEVVPHRPPRWVEIFAVQQFNEKSAQQFTVRALDPDEDITATIKYSIITDPEDTFFSIRANENDTGATLFVEPIDRDALERELFRLTLVAYKDNNELLRDEANVVIIVNDINDQRPEPLYKEYFTEILEETPLTLDFGVDFGFHDRDLGENAQYTVELRDVSPPGAAAAFTISPGEGYQRQTFFMSTANHSMLDYEVLEFQKIILELVATDRNNTDHTGVARLYIDLINWNDELPIFEETEYTATFKETVGKDFHVATVTAKDRDIDDEVIHTLMGNAADFLRINEETGDIFVNVDNAFDYHRQNVLFVQVRADDTLGAPYGTTHTATTQLVIHLEDVNNTPPTLRLPRNSPSVEENVPPEYVIDTGAIRGTDPDTTAHLEFDINWEESWATKQGRPTPAIEYRECVEIRTTYEDESNKGSAIGVIVVKEIREGITIDFEEFEVLYLSITVRDLNTVYGDDYDEAIFTVNIIDMNDNRPLFAAGSLAQTFRVREVSATGTVIGSLLATDIDGPLYNNVHYALTPIGVTPDGLVKIDPESGQMTVDANEAIDADEPPTYHLYYNVTASDRCLLEVDCPPDPTYWDTIGLIEIEIIDTNNKYPVAETELFESEVRILENVTSGYQIVQLFASDLDRDELYHQVKYQINYAWNPELRLFFEIDLDTGWLYVNYTTDAVLDRDFGSPTHTIFVNLIDNFFTAGDGRRNENTTTIEVILIDVNDQAPIMPEDLEWEISENLPAGELVMSPIIFAPDYDEPGTDNSRVGYRVLNMTTTRDVDVPILFDTDLIEHVEGNRARLRTTHDLKGFWGTHSIHVMAFDHGYPQQDSDKWYPVFIEPYNYNDPTFVFPLHGTTIRLARERVTAQSLLILADGISTLPRLSASDPDGLHAGQVSFSIVGNDLAMEYFDLTDDRDNSAVLILKTVPEDITEFQLTVRATDGGTTPGPRSADVSVRVLFVTILGDPVFDPNTVTVPFGEGPAGLEQSHDLPHAVDPKNFGCTDDCNDVFYRIVGGNTGGHFTLDPVQNKLSLLRELDQEESRTHTVLVAASNVPNPIGQPLDVSILTVVVNVIEEDPKPMFERELYTAGISTQDTIQRELLTVHATHSLGYAMTYAIDASTMEADSSLSSVVDAAFVLHPTSGLLTLNFRPSASMHGMFQFQVTATDTAGGVDRTTVKIFLISSQNRVVFTFVNTIDAVVQHTDFIASTISAEFGMIMNVDQVVPASDGDGVARDDLTDVLAHFIRDNLPVPAAQIEPWCRRRTRTASRATTSPTCWRTSSATTCPCPPHRSSPPQVVPASDGDGVIDVLAHFIRDNLPVPAAEIEPLRNDLVLLARIQSQLQQQQLQLQDLSTGAGTPGDDAQQTTIYVLAALAALLAFLCIVLLLTFICRTRALNRRLEALSMTKYGSADSGLNRMGLAPGTNKHTVEGSNPIYNENMKAPDFDAISDMSNDSDLIGIEELPQFRGDYYPPQDATSTDAIMPDRLDAVASHSNSFGFHTSPFSPEFTGRQFRK